LIGWLISLKDISFSIILLNLLGGLSKRSSKNWIEMGVTPSMACGITFTTFSLYEILMFLPTLD
jgi:hypothetical protein